MGQRVNSFTKTKFFWIAGREITYFSFTFTYFQPVEWLKEAKKRVISIPVHTALTELDYFKSHLGSVSFSLSFLLSSSVPFVDIQMPNNHQDKRKTWF